MTRVSSLALMVLSCVLITPPLVCAATPAPRKKAKGEYFYATIEGRVSQNNVTIVIEGYTTRDDGELLRLAFESGRSGGLEKALGKMNKGQFRLGTGPTNPLRIVQSVSTAKGRRVSLVADRDLEWFELRGDPLRSKEYPFTYVELDLDQNGKGSGLLMPFARVRFTDDGHLKIENYSVRPLRLVSFTPE
ncbi:MAG: hypothetical protein LAP13_02045 [Acidobacteriia bacterium]|nr:hypothetical protein [Terriglobia bacterium]